MESEAPIKILLVEDSLSDAMLLRESLSGTGPGQFAFTHVETLSQALAHLKERRFDVLLLDLTLPDSSGQQTFRRAREAAPEVPIVLLTSSASETIGLEAVRQGIQDYLSKGHADGPQTARSIRYAIERKRAESELCRARDELELRVAERTAELRQNMAALEAEMGRREQAEQALRESEERYRTLFESAPLGIAITTYKGEVMAFNRSLCALVGVTPDEVRGIPAVAYYVTPNHRRRLLAKVRRGGRSEPCEVPLRRKDGLILTVLLHMQEVRVGQEKMLMTLVQDITRQKQQEQREEGVRQLLELFATKTTLQAYAEAVVAFLREWLGCGCAGIRLSSGDGRLPFVACVGYNRAFLSLENCLSLESGDCACLRILRAQPLASDSQFSSRKGSFFCNRASRLAEQPRGDPGQRAPLACLQAGYGSLAHVPIHYHGRLLGTFHLADPREDQLPAGTASFLESIAPLVGEALHRFKIEGSLAESERRFRTMFEGHDAAMLLVDPATGAIEDANPASAAFYGYSREQLRTKKIEHLTALPPPARADWWRRSAEPGRNSLAFPHRLANGAVRAVEVHASPIELNGCRLLFAIIHDVTERKLLEKRILDIGQAERQRIGQDLHDSLGGLLTGAALLSKALGCRLEGKAIAELGVVEEIVRCINDAIGQTRAISHGLCPAGLGVAGLVAGLTEFAAETTRRSGIPCQLQVDDGVSVSDQSIALHLFRIVQEAVNNAIRHSEARHLTIRLARTGDQVLLEIRDDGKGLQRGRPGRNGLGLRTMEYRAELIGAQFAVESSEGRGTVVSCLLPWRSALPATAI